MRTDLIAAIPGVERAACIVGGMPLGDNMTMTTFEVPGVRVAEPRVSARSITPEYQRVLGIPVIRGRFFEASDRQGSALVLLINETVARTYFPNEDPIGRTVKARDLDRTIVGIVGDVHQVSLESEPLSEIYLPMAQDGRGFGELLVRTTGDPYDALPSVRAAALLALPDIPLRNVRTMEEVFDRRTAQRRLSMLLLGLFGVLGLVISAVGIYGVLAYTVAQRTREIGVRMAIGATRADVVRMVLTHAARLVALGLLIGGVAATYLKATANAFLFGIDAGDSRAFVAALAALAVAALVASAVPARRAATVDPVEALRAE